MQRYESEQDNDCAVDGQHSEHINHRLLVKQFSYNKISQLISDSHVGLFGQNACRADNISSIRQQYLRDIFGKSL
jgi:hypothetical protein